MRIGEEWEFFREELRKRGLRLGEKEEKLFRLYLKELQEWNRRFNLTAYETAGDIIVYHFLDSLLPLPFFPFREGELIDIGTGAGFPGIPLKILCPSFSLFLLEASKKRSDFLKHLIKVLGLEGVEVIEGRAEEAGRQREYRERFGIAVARGVAPLPILLEYALPLLRIGGVLIAYKGRKLGEEIKESEKALSLLGGTLRDIKEDKLPTGEERSFAFVYKERETPSRYPRRTGIPSKRPLR